MRSPSMGPASVICTTDLVLAGLLTADELEPEVRMLASCERVLSQRERGT